MANPYIFTTRQIGPNAKNSTLSWGDLDNSLLFLSQSSTDVSSSLSIYAITGSNTFTGNQTINASLTVTGSTTTVGSITTTGSITAGTSDGGESVRLMTSTLSEVMFRSQGTNRWGIWASSGLFSIQDKSTNALVFQANQGDYTIVNAKNNLYLQTNSANRVNLTTSSISFINLNTTISGSSHTISGSVAISGSLTLNGATVPTTVLNTGSLQSTTITGSLNVSGSSHTLSGSVAISGSLTLNGQAITAGSSINTGSLGSTTITGSLIASGSSHTLSGSVAISGSLTLNGQAITPAVTINTGSLQSTTITGSLIVSQSGITVTGSLAATQYADIGLGALNLPPNAPILFGSMISGSSWYSPLTTPGDPYATPLGLANFAYQNPVTQEWEIVIVLDDSRVFTGPSGLNLSGTAEGQFSYYPYIDQRSTFAIVDKVTIINAGNSSQNYTYRSGFSSTSNTNIYPGTKTEWKTKIYEQSGNYRVGFNLSSVEKYKTGQLARHTVQGTKALLLDPLSSISNAPYSPFSSSYAGWIPQGTLYFDSGSRTLGVATANNVTASVVLNSYTGSINISGSITVSGSALLSLQPQDPLPAAASYPGAFAVSASSPIRPYFSDGTAWRILF